MVVITPIPSATASATSQQLLVQLTEGLCQAYSTSSVIQPNHTISFTIGKPTVKTVVGATANTYNAIVPITISGSITYLPKRGCRALTKLFAEQITVGFTGLTTSPTAFSVTTNMETTGSANIKSNNRAYGYNINTAITVTAS